MGLTTVDGLPAHVLLVHFAVVFVPLTALALILAVVWPAARRRLGVGLPVLAAVTLAAVPLTTNAGESLERHTKPNDFLRQHAQLGDQMVLWSGVVFVVAVLWWLQHSRRVHEWAAARNERATGAVTARPAEVILGVVALVVAIGSVILVYRIGDSGAHSVWVH
jgi:uncharacterized membrane protein